MYKFLITVAVLLFGCATTSTINKSIHKTMILQFSETESIELIVPKHVSNFLNRNKFNFTENHLSKSYLILRSSRISKDFLCYDLLVHAEKPLIYLLIETNATFKQQYWKYEGGKGLPIKITGEEAKEVLDNLFTKEINPCHRFQKHRGIDLVHAT